MMYVALYKVNGFQGDGGIGWKGQGRSSQQGMNGSKAVIKFAL